MALPNWNRRTHLSRRAQSEVLRLDGHDNSSFIIQDEESSGIIDARHILGDGWFLLDVQVHKTSSDPELVEGGQLLAMFIDPRIGAAGSDEVEPE